MLWHDSVFLTLWHKWGLSKNKSWLPCYLQSKSELRPELAETVRVASLAFLLDALPTIRMSTLLDALGVCTESPTRLLYDVSWTIAGDGCSWRDQQCHRKTKKEVTQCYAPAVGFISKGGKMLHNWNKNQGDLVLAGRMLPAKTQLKYDIDMFWLGLTVDKSDKYGNLGVGLWWSHHSASVVFVEPQLRSIDLAPQSWRAPYSADADCKMLGWKF